MSFLITYASSVYESLRFGIKAFLKLLLFVKTVAKGKPFEKMHNTNIMDNLKLSFKE